MEIEESITIAKKISWGSITGGLITVISVSLILSILGSGLGLSIVDPLSETSNNDAGMTLLFWAGATIIISLATGAFVAGRVATNEGFIHGFLVWASSLIVACILVIMLVGGAIKTTGNALGSLIYASGSLLSGAGSITVTGLQEVSSLGSQLFDDLDIDTSIEPQKIQSNVKEALRKSGIPSIQPEFVQQQLAEAKRDLSSALKSLALQPSEADTIIQDIVDKLQERAASITKDLDRNTLKRALADNSEMTKSEIDYAVNNIISAKKKTDEILNKTFEDIQLKIEQAKQEYDELKKNALEKAAEAAPKLARIAFFVFLSLVIGALISGYAGRLGERVSRINS